jgi:signal transduction histidine kinase
MELVVFRLVQESLTNIHRHSGSKTAYIRIGRQDDTLRVEIQDEGKGISPGRMAEIQSRGSGVGIRGMRERLNQIHGTMTIQSSPSGTRISATIPVPKDSREGLGGAESLPTAV